MLKKQFPISWQSRFSPFCAAGLIAVFVITAALSVWDKSSTWDDPYHLTGGVAQLQTGDPRLNADHPPLARLLAAIPTLFMKIDSVAESAPDAWKSADLTAVTNRFFGTIEDRLLWWSRLTMLTLAALIGWLLYAWGARLFGPERALLPVALFAFCPPLLANAPLITTDMAATTFIFAAFYTWWRYLQEPSHTRLAWVCLSVAAAFASKYTAIILIPLFLILGVIAVISTTVLPFNFSRRLQIVSGGLLVIGIATLTGIDLVYLFDGVFLTPPEYIAHSMNLIPPLQTGAQQLSRFWPAWLPVPLPFYYVSGLLSVLANVGVGGHATYFLGQAGYGGWPNYFLMLLLVKLPIPTLILVGLGISHAFSRLSREWWNVLFLVLPPLVLIWMASNGKMQIGIRHILPAFPFLFLLAGYTLSGRLNRRRSFFVGALAALIAVSSLAVHPHYLMYFNFLGGGPEQGWRISVTGDDYGQGDADLRRWLQARGIKELAYGPFGWGSVVLNRAGIKTKPLPCEDTGELVATHLGQLLLTYTLDKTQCYTWMRLREPDEKIGYSIFIYNSKKLRPSAQGAENMSLPFERADQRAKTKPTAENYLNLGLSYYQAQRFEDAIRASYEALKIRPDYDLAHNNICASYNSMKMWDKAIEACEKGLSVNPDNQLMKNNLSWAKKNAGK